MFVTWALVRLSYQNYTNILTIHIKQSNLVVDTSIGINPTKPHFPLKYKSYD